MRKPEQLGKVHEITKPKPKIEILDSAAIFAPLPTPALLVDPIIPRGSLTEVVAYGASGKSWLATTLAISVGSGRPYLGRFPCCQGRALILDWENGSHEERRRLQANARALGLPFPVPGVALASMPDLYMTNDDFQVEMARIADGYDLVVIDTLRAASPGVDENDSRIRTGLDWLRRIGERTGAAFVVLVHSKKMGITQNGIDPREAGRGSSAIFDAADVVLHVTYTKGEPLRIHQTKARTGRLLEPFNVTITDTESGGVLVTAADIAPTEDRQFEEFCDRVLVAVKATPGGSTRLITEKSKGRYGSTKAALEHLSRHGAVTNAGNDRNAKWFPVLRKSEAADIEREAEAS